jgi:hypothetical protein
VGHRIQGVLVRELPSAAALDSIAERYPFRLFEMAGSPIWILDLGVPGFPERATIRTARSVAPNYVDAVRVLDGEEHDLEQLCWFNAAVAVGKVLRTEVLGFVSDDSRLDFAIIAGPDGVSVIGDHVEPYLVRWDAKVLTIQPYSIGGGRPPRPPEELGLIPSVTLLPAEPLPDGVYPLHGNVTAEIFEFAPLAAGIIGDAAVASPSAVLKLVAARGLDTSCWDA